MGCEKLLKLRHRKNNIVANLNMNLSINKNKQKKAVLKLIKVGLLQRNEYVSNSQIKTRQRKIIAKKTPLGVQRRIDARD